MAGYDLPHQVFGFSLSWEIVIAVFFYSLCSVFKILQPRKFAMSRVEKLSSETGIVGWWVMICPTKCLVAMSRVEKLSSETGIVGWWVMICPTKCLVLVLVGKDYLFSKQVR
ncbi:hypothetical protein I3843_08G132100 [Carya illinoinensis]|nr:hypothetical protein I3843_08G132100 [Carya illinoinensis]